MTTTMDKALDAVAKLAPQDNQPSRSRVTHKFRNLLASELRALQTENDALRLLLSRVCTSTRIRGPLGMTAYIISDSVMDDLRRALV